MECIRIIDTNAANIHHHSLCGYKNSKNEGYRKKVEWLKERYTEGLRYKILYSDKDGDIGAIEYIPGEYAWRPVEATGYFLIHCIFILPREYKGKGYGSLLVEECLKDATMSGRDGVAVVTRKGTWMAGRDLFIKKGFEVADTMEPDFELLVKKLSPSAPTPAFVKNDGRSKADYPKGLYMFPSSQCPYSDKAEKEIAETAKSDYAIDINIVKIGSCRDAAQSPCAFGTFCMVYNGEVIADHPVSKTRFKNIMNKLI